MHVAKLMPPLVLTHHSQSKLSRKRPSAVFVSIKMLIFAKCVLTMIWKYSILKSITQNTKLVNSKNCSFRGSSKWKRWRTTCNLTNLMQAKSFKDKHYCKKSNNWKSPITKRNLRFLKSRKKMRTSKILSITWSGSHEFSKTPKVMN